MEVDDKTWIKIHGAETLEEGLAHVAPACLENHMFFEAALLENEDFKNRVIKEVPK